MNTTTKTSAYQGPEITKSSNLAEVELTYKSKIKASERAKVVNSLSAADILRGVWSNKIDYIEEFALLLLNRQNQVLGWAKISVGGVSGTVVDAKIVFQLALNANASNIILCHNHPSGNLNPSQEDISLTRKLREGAKFLDLQIFDHIILTSESYYSFADNGLL